MEPIRASEINEIIRKQIENFDNDGTVTEVGTVIKIGDGIAELHGLEKVMAGELLDFPHDVRGLALNLEEDKVGAVLFGEFQKIREGDLVKRTGRIMEVPVGEAMVRYAIDFEREPYRPASPGGESWAQFMLRVSVALDRVTREHEGRTIVVVTHGGFIDVAFLHFFRMNALAFPSAHFATRHTSLTHWQRRRRWGRAEAYALLPPLWALLLLWTPLWLARFRYGPAEWLWRSVARGRAQPLRRG